MIVATDQEETEQFKTTVSEEEHMSGYCQVPRSFRPGGRDYPVDRKANSEDATYRYTTLRFARDTPLARGKTRKKRKNIIEEPFQGTIKRPEWTENKRIQSNKNYYEQDV